MCDTSSQVLKQVSVPVAANIYRVLTGFTTLAQESSEDVQAHGHELVGVSRSSLSTTPQGGLTSYTTINTSSPKLKNIMNEEGSLKDIVEVNCWMD